MAPPDRLDPDERTRDFLGLPRDAKAMMDGRSHHNIHAMLVWRSR